MENDLCNIDIFVNLSFLEPINDYEVISLLQGIPTISPRTASRSELLLELPELLETYYFQDARELKLSLSKYLDDYSNQKTLLLKLREKLFDWHGLDSYAGEILSAYELGVASRIRLNDSRRSSS